MLPTESLAEKISYAWMEKTGLSSPYPLTIRAWIAAADSEKEIFDAIDQAGRKCSAAAMNNNAKVVAQAVKYTANILRSSAQARASAAAQ